MHKARFQLNERRDLFKSAVLQQIGEIPQLDETKSITCVDIVPMHGFIRSGVVIRIEMLTFCALKRWV
jgi:hypothetical protein